MFEPPHGAKSLAYIQQGQQTQAKGPNSGGAASAELNQRLQQLPEYKAYIEALQHIGAGVVPHEKLKALGEAIQREGLQIPEDLILDPYTAGFREKSWDEKHNALSGLAYTGLAVGIGLGVGGAASMAAGTGAAGGAESGAVSTGAITAADEAAAQASAFGGANAAGAGLSLGKGLGTASKVADLLRGTGLAIGDAASTAGNNRVTQETLDLNANGQNIQGQNAFETQLLNRSKLEADQRSQVQKDVYRKSYATNRQPGPFNQAGLTQYSPEYLATLTDLEKQALLRLKKPPDYGTDTMPAVQPYQKYVPSQTKNGQPSTMETLGGWLGPGMTIAGALSKYF